MTDIKDEGIINPGIFADAQLDREFYEQAIVFVLKKIDGNMEQFSRTFPDACSKRLVYPAVDNIGWTPGFWTGLLWLAYDLTGAEKYRNAAEAYLSSFKGRLEANIDTDHHDLGFLYTLSCVAQFKRTANATARETALHAAEKLTTRYVDKAGIIQAWGDLNNPEQSGRMIIDCCLNLPLLYWAACETGERRYHQLAYNHAKQAAKYIVRPDASTYHTFYMDVETGTPRFGRTHQGYADDSCWARGQAWGIYGFPLSYAYTGDTHFLELSKRLIHYFLNRLPEDGICYWDLCFTEGQQERDSSAAAIAVCGILEILKYLPLTDIHRLLYEKAVRKIMRSLAEQYTIAAEPQSNGILMHAVYNKNKGKGVDECCIWGDYFYFEALVRLVTTWKAYW